MTPPKTWPGVLALEGRVLAFDDSMVVTRKTYWIELANQAGSHKLRLWTEGSGRVLDFVADDYGWTFGHAFRTLGSAKQTDELERWLATHYDN